MDNFPINHCHLFSDKKTTPETVVPLVRSLPYKNSSSLDLFQVPIF